MERKAFIGDVGLELEDVDVEERFADVDMGRGIVVATVGGIGVVDVGRWISVTSLELAFLFVKRVRDGLVCIDSGGVVETNV